MVHEGMDTESMDRMSIPDLMGWYQVMLAFQKEVAKNRPKPPRKPQ